MQLQLDDSFLNDLGLGDATDEQKQALVLRMLETLELRVGARLSEDLSDEQIEEFEKITQPGDPAASENALEWVKANHPRYQEVVNEELAILKQEMTTSLNSVMDKSA